MGVVKFHFLFLFPFYLVFFPVVFLHFSEKVTCHLSQPLTSPFLFGSRPVSLRYSLPTYFLVLCPLPRSCFSHPCHCFSPDVTFRP